MGNGMVYKNIRRNDSAVNDGGIHDGSECSSRNALRPRVCLAGSFQKPFASLSRTLSRPFALPRVPIPFLQKPSRQLLSINVLTWAPFRALSRARVFLSRPFALAFRTSCVQFVC